MARIGRRALSLLVVVLLAALGLPSEVGVAQGLPAANGKIVFQTTRYADGVFTPGLGTIAVDASNETFIIATTLGHHLNVWGGVDGTGAVDTGGNYDPVGNLWTTTTITGVSARFNHTAVWTGSKMIVWGSYDNAGNLTNTGDQWSALSLYAKN